MGFTLVCENQFINWIVKESDPSSELFSCWETSGVTFPQKFFNSAPTKKPNGTEPASRHEQTRDIWYVFAL